MKVNVNFLKNLKLILRVITKKNKIFYAIFFCIHLVKKIIIESQFFRIYAFVITS